MNDKDKARLKKFGLHLEKVRMEKGLSQRQLAARCDVDYGKISKLENNKANVTLTTLLEIADGLDMHITELLDVQFD